jgi:hypothetical protein
MIKSLDAHLRKMIYSELEKSFTVDKITFEHSGILWTVLTRGRSSNEIRNLLK